eukprot:scaffold47727_cov69-Phaeocystis_antarctica.AAC.5
MLVTWPTSHASTGWLKAAAERNIYCAAHTHEWTPSRAQRELEPSRHDLALTAPTQSGGAPACWLKAVAEKNTDCAAPAHTHVTSAATLQA